MTYTVDPRVDAYIVALPAWQRVICREVRELVHAADREVIETIKRTRQPYFVLQGNICALALTVMVKQIIANNRAGGWRKLKRKER